MVLIDRVDHNFDLNVSDDFMAIPVWCKIAGCKPKRQVNADHEIKRQTMPGSQSTMALFCNILILKLAIKFNLSH